MEALAPEQLARLVEPLLALHAAGWLEGFSLGTEAFDDWVARRLTPVVTPALVGGAEQALVGMLPDGDRFAEASS